MSGASSPTSSGDACAAPRTPPVEDEGVSQLQRAFFAVEQPKQATTQTHTAALHRSSSEPALNEARESVASWHLAMIVNAIGPKHGAQAPAGPQLHRRSSAVDFNALTE